MKKIVDNLFVLSSKTEREAFKKHSDHKINKTVLRELHTEEPEELVLQIPNIDSKTTLHLKRVNHQPSVKSASGASVESHRGIFYQSKDTYAAVHLTDNGVHTLFGTPEGNINVSHFGNGDHVSFNPSDLDTKNPFVCETRGEFSSPDSKSLLEPQGIVQKQIQFHWELNYEIFQNLKTLAACQSFALGLFNQVQALYAQDGIIITLKSLKIWDIPSPYTSSDAGTLLDQFVSSGGAFDGDLAHLIGYKGSGGVAYVGMLCAFSYTQKRAYSGISTSYTNIPIYSWSVENVTHEAGHLLGSPHTHDCWWNGNYTKIDCCGDHSGYTMGACGTDIPDPIGGGTIMSYCHLRPVGINLSKGFGEQPKNLMLNNINNASCLTPVTPIQCVPESDQIQNISCPSGQTGTITQKRTSSCVNNALVWSDWVTISNTCTIPPPPTLGTAHITSIPKPSGIQYKCTFTYCTNTKYSWTINNIDINFHQQVFIPKTHYPAIKPGDQIQCKITGVRCPVQISSNILTY